MSSEPITNVPCSLGVDGAGSCNKFGGVTGASIAATYAGSDGLLSHLLTMENCSQPNVDELLRLKDRINELLGCKQDTTEKEMSIEHGGTAPGTQSSLVAKIPDGSSVRSGRPFASADAVNGNVAPGDVHAAVDVPNRYMDAGSLSDAELDIGRMRLPDTGAVPKHGLVWRLVPGNSGGFLGHNSDSQLQAGVCRDSSGNETDQESTRHFPLNQRTRKPGRVRFPAQLLGINNEINRSESDPVVNQSGTTFPGRMLASGSAGCLSQRTPCSVVGSSFPSGVLGGMSFGALPNTMSGLPNIFDDYSESDSNLTGGSGDRRGVKPKMAGTRTRNGGRQSDSDNRGRMIEPQASQIRTGSDETVGQLVSALQRLDVRTYPAPDPFDVTSGRSFADFFADFEQYCGSKYVGSSDRWMSELGRFLIGDLVGVFDALRGPNDTYAEVKSKLLRWFNESRLNRRSATVVKFKQACREVHETLYVYGVRLEKLFRLAYPRKHVETSRTLQRRYIDTVPHDFGQQLNYSYGVVKLVGQTFGWSQVLQLALMRDNQSPNWSSRLNPEAPCYNVRDVTSRPRVKDASVQTSLAPVATAEKVIRSQPASSMDKRHESSLESLECRDTRCSYCKRRGHNYDNCRRRLKQCLRCGSAEHFQGACPQMQAGKSKELN